MNMSEMCVEWKMWLAKTHNSNETLLRLHDYRTFSGPHSQAKATTPGCQLCHLDVKSRKELPHYIVLPIFFIGGE